MKQLTDRQRTLSFINVMLAGIVTLLMLIPVTKGVKGYGNFVNFQIDEK